MFQFNLMLDLSQKSLKQLVRDYLPSLLLTLPLVANLFSRNTAEYFFDLLILTTLTWASTRSRGISWGNLVRRSAFDYIWPALLLSIAVSYTINKTWGEPQIHDLVQFLWILGLYCFTRVLSAAKFPRYSLHIFCAFIIITSAALITDFFLHPTYDPTVWGLPNRLLGTFTNTNFLAQSYYIVALFICGLIVTHLTKGDIKRTILLVITLIFLGSVLLLTFNRSIWIASIVVIPFLASTWKKWAGPTFFLISIFAGLVLYKTNIGGFTGRIDRTISPSSSGDITRLNLWKTNLYIFKQHPIFGIGYYNNSRDIVKYYKELGISNGTLESHAHNEILSFLAGTGIVGTILFLALFAHFGALGWKALKLESADKPIKKGILLGAFITQPAFLIMGIADNNFEIHSARHFLVVSWAIILYFAYENGVLNRSKKLRNDAYSYSIHQ